MRRLLSILTICLPALATPCAAQTFACGVSGIPLTVLGGAPFVAVTPPAPNASQAIAITVGMVNYNPIGAVAVVTGTSINITFTASYLGFASPPALSCSNTSVGPLPAGTYVVNLFLVDPGLPIPAPIQVAAGTLAVAPGLATIPTMSGAGVVILALFLLVGGWCARRRISPN